MSSNLSCCIPCSLHGYFSSNLHFGHLCQMLCQDKWREPIGKPGENPMVWDIKVETVLRRGKQNINANALQLSTELSTANISLPLLRITGSFINGEACSPCGTNMRGSIPPQEAPRPEMGQRHCVSRRVWFLVVLIPLWSFFVQQFSALLSAIFLFFTFLPWPLSLVTLCFSPSCFTVLQGCPKRVWSQRICLGSTFFLLYSVPLLTIRNAFLTSFLSQLLGCCWTHEI